jgi:hypothetical protein
VRQHHAAQSRAPRLLRIPRVTSLVWCERRSDGTALKWVPATAVLSTRQGSDCDRSGAGQRVVRISELRREWWFADSARKPAG